MTEQEIIENLKSSKKFAYFTSDCYLEFKVLNWSGKFEDKAKVLCDNLSHTWEETWDDMEHTIFAFQNGDYRFID